LDNHVKKIIDLALWILLLCFFVSLVALIIYVIDFNFSDTTLFFLLSVIRYSSFMLCICAFYKLSLNIYRSFRDRKFHIVRLTVYLIFIVYGIIIILFNLFIIAISRGNE